LRDSVLAMVHGVMSGMLQPTFDLSPWANAPPDLLRRVRQVGSLVPLVTPGPVELSSFRRQLDSFFAAYEPEFIDRGHPTWHPLPFEFPDDPESALHADEFMLGDEMLIAPIFDSTGRRTLYLPQGTWTDLETNQALPGRKTITVSTPSLPVFARSGTIIPLDSPAGVALHYFPKLAAEFFLLERDLDEYSQVHAAPAADEMRLEIESKKDRDYQWVVHHVERPSEVGFAGVKYRQVTSSAQMTGRTWFYDAARKNLQVKVTVKAGEDCIVNLKW
jgi:alpha-glucosidase (family GH31 glycosyl hydrolase)